MVLNVYFAFELSLFHVNLGALSLRMDAVRVMSSAESSKVSLQGVGFSAIKTLTENTETCCPSSQVAETIGRLTAMALCYHVSTHTLQVEA